MDPRPLQDKVVVIVGGTTGLGYSAARACVDAGAQVVIVGRNPDNARVAAASLVGDAQATTGDAAAARALSGLRPTITICAPASTHARAAE